MKRALTLAAFCLSLAAPLPSAAQAAESATFPNKMVKIVVPFTAGGSSDHMGRLFAKYLGEIWKVTVIVENKPGASGTLGGEYVRRSTPDGHTLLLPGPSSTTMLMAVSPNKSPYDPLKDFAPVTVAATFQSVLAVSPQVPAKTLPEFIQLLKANPGKYTYASSGAGTSSHLYGELFKSMAGVDMLHIPFSGSGPGINAVVSGHVTASIVPENSVAPLVKNGRLVALGTTGDKRSKDLPEVPTIGETVKGFLADSWIGLFAPKGTPPAVVKKIADDLRTVLKNPEVVQKMDEMGLTGVGSTPEEMQRALAEDLQRWQRVVKAANITAD